MVFVIFYIYIWISVRATYVDSCIKLSSIKYTDQPFIINKKITICSNVRKLVEILSSNIY